MRGQGPGGYKVHFETFLLDFFFLDVMPRYILCIQKFIQDLNTLGMSSPLPNMRLKEGGEKIT
ncbi:hypothetical protein RLOC_00005698 [Lonchura striata]|uniref:Uncharacterized protein n=1 Tax=Lonchura striata TaxID=40157 RepID=A0A218UNG9_9PASE|nr:hypothetical protein RLOC_00005698 [Lonchura striata domestica]